MLQVPITINNLFIGTCNGSINMGKQLYNSKIHLKNIDNLSKIYISTIINLMM